jgi:hypothetical protein
VIPLTHHDIMTLVGPFSRDGRRVDLAATDRAARKIVFASRLVGAEHLTLTESLALENPRNGEYRVVRTLRDAGGVTAQLTVDAASPESAYTRVLATPPETQFTRARGLTMGYSYRVDLVQSDAAALSAAETTFGTLRLCLEQPPGLRTPAEITLQGADDWQLPEDLLSVMGGAWRPLAWRRDRWRGQLRTTRREPQRSVQLRTNFERTAAHLASIFTQSPAMFHPRFRGARWRAAFRRGVPLLVYIAMLGSLPLVHWLWFDRGGTMPAWALGLPPLLLIAGFLAASYEVPEIVIPPLPRPLHPEAWPPDASATRP